MDKEFLRILTIPLFVIGGMLLVGVFFAFNYLTSDEDLEGDREMTPGQALRAFIGLFLGMPTTFSWSTVKDRVAEMKGPIVVGTIGLLMIAAGAAIQFVL